MIAVTIVGFVFSFIWYSFLFGKAWMTEMKIDPAAPRPSMAPYIIKSLIYTFISTLGLAWIIIVRPIYGREHGAAVGLVVGVLIVGARYANSGVWEKRSCKLVAINVGHEVLLFVLQGAILGRWIWHGFGF